jgi:hypothetical protein
VEFEGLAKLGLELKQKYPRSHKLQTIFTPHFWSEKMLSFTMVEFEGKLKLGLELKQKNPRSHKLRTIFTPHFWSG